MKGESQAAQEAIRLNPDMPFGYNALAVHNIYRLTGSQRPRMPCSGPRSANWKSRKCWSPATISRFLRATRREWSAKSIAPADSTGDGGLDVRTIRPWCSRVPVKCSRRGPCGSARSRLAQQDGDREKAAHLPSARRPCAKPISGMLRLRRKGPRGRRSTSRKGRDVEYAAAFALALSGDSSGSQTLAEDLAKRFPEDTPVQFEYLPTLRRAFRALR